MSVQRLVFVGSLAGFLMASVVWAGSAHPNLQEGLALDKSYSIGEIDSVNLFNGNLGISIPIGRSYPVGPNLSYQFMLTYNSKIWDYCAEEVGSQVYTIATPSSESNAGAGWRFGLGYFLPDNVPTPCGGPNVANHGTYVSPDGASHAFYTSPAATLGEFSGTEGGWEGKGLPESTTYYYTRDGSRLRMRKVSGRFVVQFPNGNHHLFDGSGRLIQMKDPFNNSVSLSYGGEYYTVTDTHGRNHSVDIPTHVVGAPMIEAVHLEGYGGGRSNYRFAYDTKVDWTRSCLHFDGSGSSGEALVQFLLSVTLPDDTIYEMTEYFDPKSDADPTKCSSSGYLTRMVLPTHGELSWEYKDWYFNTSASQIDLGSGERQMEFLSRSPGVVKRSVDPKAGGRMRTWLYSQAKPSSPVPPPYRTTTVTTPLLDQSVHYFATEDLLYYGLPFNPTVTQAGASRFLSVTIPTGSGDRTSYVQYEYDSTLIPDVTAAQNNNRREVSTSTIYEDNTSTFTDRSDWDDRGHYREVRRGGSFSNAPDRKTTKSYPQGLPTGSSWVLSTFDASTVSEIDEDGQQTGTVTTQFCFDTTTGALKRSRRLSGDSPGANDLLTVFTYAQGFLRKERFFGGDGGGLSGGDLCSTSTPAGSLDYEIQHETENGVRSRSSYLGAGGASVGWNLLDRTIHRSGVVSSSRDANGVGTSYFYDAMGRVTRVNPQALAGWTTITYGFGSVPGATTTTVPLVTLSRSGASTESTLLLETVLYNGVGQRVLERRSSPAGAGQFAVRKTAYDEMGWKDSKSPWMPTASAAETTYRNYDPFGRPGRINLPDGKDIVLLYSGVFWTNRKTSIATEAAGALTESSTREFYDPFGRIVKVREPSGPINTNVITRYDYDVLGNLTEVIQNVGGSQQQTRTFSYDNLGFLRSEYHPESGLTEYKSYDARGNAGEIWKGGQEVRLRNTFDKAERIRTVHDLVLGQDLLGYQYETNKARVQTATRYSLFEPFEAAIPAPITETYTYGSHGYVIERDTNAQGYYHFRQKWTYNSLGFVETLEYPRCYNGNGLTNCDTTEPSLELKLGYDRGALKTVREKKAPSYLFGELSHHLNGMVYTVTHANGMIDTIDIDAQSWLPRPFGIHYAFGEKGSAVETLSNYTYDGAGNLASIHCDDFNVDEYYAYDLVSRLTQQTLCGGAVHDYAYDRFGNLIQKTSNGIAQPIPIDSTTNRLSSSGLAGYNGRGNLTSWGNNLYTWDALDSLMALDNRTSDLQHRYIYTADGERLLTIASTAGLPESTSVFTLRDLDGQSLTEYDLFAGQLTWKKDYIYRGSGQLLASRSAEHGERHYSLNHLGTPTVISDSTGSAWAQQFRGFGEQMGAAQPALSSESRKFTGHERDPNYAASLPSPSDDDDDLDYMHARYYSPHLARFLSVDPVGGNLMAPQSWNRYAYVMGNPLKYVDPHGLFPAIGWLLETAMVAASDSSINVYGAMPSGEGLQTLISGGMFMRNLSQITGGPEVGPFAGVRSYYQGRFEQAAVEGGASYAGAYIDWIGLSFFIPESWADLGMEGVFAVVPPLRGEKIAGEVITGALRNSKSFRSELAGYTRSQLVELSKGKGPLAHAAKGMKKLMDQGPRLKAKLKRR